MNLEDFNFSKYSPSQQIVALDVIQTAHDFLIRKGWAFVGFFNDYNKYHFLNEELISTHIRSDGYTEEYVEITERAMRFGIHRLPDENIKLMMKETPLIELGGTRHYIVDRNIETVFNLETPRKELIGLLTEFHNNVNYALIVPHHRTSEDWRYGR